MLIEFSVANFMSFRERQTLSMVAAPRLRKKECLIRPDVPGEKLPDLLKVVAIYGPNASGKSSLVRALSAVQIMARVEPSSATKRLPGYPFRFDPGLTNEASEFEVHFVHENLRYQFEISLTEERVILERLTAYPRGIEKLYYERKFLDGKESYIFGEGLEGDKTVHSAWQQLTSPQLLFISQAVANSSDNLKQLRLPLKWLQGDINIIENIETSYWARMIKSFGKFNPEFGTGIAKYLRDVDVPVTDVKFENANDDEISAPIGPYGPTIDKAYKVFSTGEEVKTTLTHTTALGTADFDFNEESRGTQNLLGFYLPYSLLKRRLVIVDELDSSLHPKILATLVEKFLNTESTGQLIFTTHDTHLMDAKILRRDQFWLTERNANGATRLRSVHDFVGRESEAIEKRYYEGHYRGLPYVEPGAVAKRKSDKKADK